MPITVKTGDLVWCTHHGRLMRITDDNIGHPAGEYRPVRAESLDGQFSQAIPLVYFREATEEEIGV